MALEPGIGNTYNKLTILSSVPSHRDKDIQNNITPKLKQDMGSVEYARYGVARCVVKCECGNVIEWSLTDVKSGRKKYCGLSNCTAGKKSFKVDQPKNDQERTIHSRWESMHQRCYNEKHHSYAHYGAVGVVVDEEWNRTNPNGRKNYTEWFINELNKPETEGMLEPTVDRLDNTKGYSSGNCRLASKSVQSANQSIVNRENMKSSYKFVIPAYSKYKENTLYGYKIGIRYEFISYTMMIKTKEIPDNIEFVALLCTYYIKWKNRLIYTSLQPIPYKIYVCSAAETKQHAKYTIAIKKTINKNDGIYKNIFKHELEPYSSNIGLRVVKWLDDNEWKYSTIAMHIDILKIFAIQDTV